MPAHDQIMDSMSTIEKAAARLVAKQKGNLPAKVLESETAEDDRTSAVELSSSSTVVGPVNEAEVVIKDDEKGIAEKFAVDEGIPSQHSGAIEHICELDFEWLSENGFLVPGHNNPQQAQEFRRIKRPLLLNTQPKLSKDLPLAPNLIFITSALPGEGKTFVSLNLALSLAAELDKRVLLLDGDAAKADLSRWLGVHEEQGLVDLLSSGQAYAERAVINTNVDRLSVMPCGQVVDNLDELYASGLMESFLTGLVNFDRDRIVLVDGPPLMLTTEAAVLARQMGQVVMVVEANKTPQSAVEQAVAQLESCQMVSMLLNKASSSASSGYGYGYGYGYGKSEQDN